MQQKLEIGYSSNDNLHILINTYLSSFNINKTSRFSLKVISNTVIIRFCAPHSNKARGKQEFEGITESDIEDACPEELMIDHDDIDDNVEEIDIKI